MSQVRPAATSCVQFVLSTDEVPRRLLPSGGVSPGYKSHTKGQGNASETGTAFPRPRPKGCQQRQSRGVRRRLAVSACSERQNLKVPPGPLWSTGPVSPATAATKWRDGTSSCQLAGPLSNSPHGPRPGRPESETDTPVNIGNGPYRDNGEGVAARPLPYPLLRAFSACSSDQLAGSRNVQTPGPGVLTRRGVTEP